MYMTYTKWMPRSGEPIYQQLADYIKKMIKSGVYPPGYTFPPYRRMAVRFGLSRNMLTSVFDRLEAEGFIIRRGNSSIVTTVEQPPDAQDASIWDAHLSEPLNTDMTDLSLISHEFSRINIIQQSIRKMASAPPGSLRIHDPRGIPELREYIKSHLGHHGIDVNIENIMIIPSARAGAYTIRTGLFDPGTVLYSAAGIFYPALVNDRTGLCYIKRDDKGLIPSDLITKLSDAPRKMLYIEPVCSWPEGLDQSGERIDEIIEICASNNIHIIEGDLQRSLLFRTGKPPLKATDRRGILYMSQILPELGPFAGISFMAGPDYLIRYLADTCMQISGYHKDLAQFITLDLLTNGYTQDKFLEALKERHLIAGQLFNKYLNGMCRWRRPTGGLSLTLTFDKPIEPERFSIPRGLCAFSPMSLYGGSRDQLAIGVMSSTIELLEEFIKSLRDEAAKQL